MLKGIVVNGPITSSEPKAFDCMIQRTELLKKITDCFRTSPVKYVSICGPVQSGKSTIVEQIKQSVESNSSPIVVASIDLLHSRPDDDLEKITNRISYCIHHAIRQFTSKSDLLTAGIDDGDDHFVIGGFSEDFETQLDTFLSLLPREVRLLLTLENVDLVQDSGIWELLSELRRIHDRRAGTPLEKFSVLTTSTASLTIQHGEVVSPFNCAEEFFLEDINSKEMRHFINRIASLNELEIDEPAQALLLEYCSGTISVLQEVLAYITFHRKINFAHAAKAIAEVVESSSRFSKFAINDASLSKEAQEMVVHLLQKYPVIGFEGNKGFRELRRRGLVSVSQWHWVRFRSRIIELLAAVRYLGFKSLGRMSRPQALITNLPQIRLVLSNGSYVGEVIGYSQNRIAKEVPKGSSVGKRNILRETVEASDIPIQWEFTYEMLKRYWDPNELGEIPPMGDFKLEVYDIISEALIDKV